MFRQMDNKMVNQLVKQWPISQTVVIKMMKARCHILLTVKDEVTIIVLMCALSLVPLEKVEMGHLVLRRTTV